MENVKLKNTNKFGNLRRFKNRSILLFIIKYIRSKSRIIAINNDSSIAERKFKEWNECIISDVLGFILWREEVGEGEIIKAGFP